LDIMVRLVLIGFGLTLLGGCGDSDTPEVVLYVSADDYVAREVVAAFEAAHDIRVRMVGDTEAQKTTGLVERLRSERDAPVADVFWSSEVFLTVALADEGILIPSAPATAADRPASSRDADGRWHGFAARARVIAYDPERIAAEDLPQAWSDLAHDRWAGRVVMADPRFGTTGGHLGVMRSWWDRRLIPGFYDAWLLGLRDAEVRMLPGGNAAAVRAVLDGEADLAMTDSDDVWAAEAAGGRIAMIYPRHDKDPGAGRGTLLIPNTVGLVAGGPNPDAGLALVTFLLSPEVERILAESDSRNIPMHPSLAGAYPELDVPDPLVVDFARAAAARTGAVDRALRLLLGDPEGDDWPDATEPAGDAGDVGDVGDSRSPGESSARTDADDDDVADDADGRGGGPPDESRRR
jgi:iron(III) transport system substrate-binding protein